MGFCFVLFSVTCNFQGRNFNLVRVQVFCEYQDSVHCSFLWLELPSAQLSAPGCLPVCVGWAGLRERSRCGPRLESMGQGGVEAWGQTRLKLIPLSFLPLLSTVSAPGVSSLTILHDTDQFL